MIPLDWIVADSMLRAIMGVDMILRILWDLIVILIMRLLFFLISCNLGVLFKGPREKVIGNLVLMNKMLEFFNGWK